MNMQGRSVAYFQKSENKFTIVAVECLYQVFLWFHDRDR